MQQLVSIIVPVYKVENYLDKCLQSIVSQTYSNIEIILVDDGSPDNCPTMCEKWAQNDRRIKVIHQRNSGVSAARNVGIEIASGELICFIDSDDFVDQSLCQKAVSEIEKNGADIVVFDAIRVTESGEPLETTENIKHTCLNKEEAMRELFLGNIHDYACNKIFKRELFSDVRFPIERIFEDIGTMYKVFLNAQKVCCLPEELYNYRKRRGSVIDVMSDGALRDLFELRKKRYLEVRQIMPDIAESGFALTALSAKRFIDRSFWSDVDQIVLNEAKSFIYENKRKILRLNITEVTLFVLFPKTYRFFRLIKHKAGNVLKKIMHKI